MEPVAFLQLLLIHAFLDLELLGAPSFVPASETHFFEARPLLQFDFLNLHIALILFSSTFHFSNVQG